MNRTMLAAAADRFLDWDAEIGQNTRLERHEAMKAILFGLSSSARLEHQMLLNSRKVRYDFLDENIVIEIDDGPNRKSLRKLAAITNKEVLWILILAKGKGGQARANAAHHRIPILRILTKPRSCWEWIDPPQGGKR